MKHQSKSYDTPQETTRLLYESVKTARETEDIGNLTTEEMIFQREMLVGTSEKVC